MLNGKRREVRACNSIDLLQIKILLIFFNAQKKKWKRKLGSTQQKKMSINEKPLICNINVSVIYMHFIWIQI